ncbi:MAG: aminopeptidase N [Candidatus Azotimanducaceae bacterium]
MKEGQPKLVRLDEYQSPAFVTDNTRLKFDIEDGRTRVSSELDIRRVRGDSTEIYLNGEELELVSVSVDGRVISENEYSVDDFGMTIFGLGEAHTIEIVTEIVPEQNTALEGLYKSSAMYCTQCEAEGFRKITYYQDRPDILSRFTTTVIADGERFPNLLSNGNLVKEESLNGGRKSATWSDPFPKPSYLFALVVGNLSVLEDVFVTKSGRRVNLKIYSEAHNIEQCHYAMDALKRSMKWDEERFGREYDLDIFMIVAVEDFNMGAMENKGLNIFNTSCVLASPNTATDQAYQRVEAVVAHEYFHNWSGNRVTCRDWFQLSLKEGFTVYRDALFSGDMNSHAVKRIEDVGFLRSIQFAEDAGPLSHPVRPDSYIEISNFYTPTIYEKGAEIVRMYNTMLGGEKFRQATDLYFDRHDGTAATTDDFASTMEEVGGVDLKQFKRWYQQAGTPLLTVSESFQEGILRLEVEQSCPSTPGQLVKKPFHIPVELGLINSDGQPSLIDSLDIFSDAKHELLKSGQSLLFHLKSEKTKIELGSFDAKPVVSFLREFTAPVKVDYSRPLSELVYLARLDTDGFVRWDSLQSLWVEYFKTDGKLQGVDAIDSIGAIAKGLLEESLEAEAKHLMAYMLKIPDENYLFEQLERFEVIRIIELKEGLINQIASRYLDTWREIYKRFQSRDAFSPMSDAMANRALANLAFEYVARGMGSEELADFVKSHYFNANNLTDRKTALNFVCRDPRLNIQVREEVLGDFYERWSSEALVLDLWFSVQAQSSLTSIEELKKLESHPLFDRKNPNRVRSVFSSFGMGNHFRFHATDGSGYEYLANVVSSLDESNPQLAARLAGPLTRWGRYDTSRQRLMIGALKNMASSEGISKDLYEIVSKSLDTLP